MTLSLMNQKSLVGSIRRDDFSFVLLVSVMEAGMVYPLLVTYTMLRWEYATREYEQTHELGIVQADVDVSSMQRCNRCWQSFDIYIVYLRAIVQKVSYLALVHLYIHTLYIPRP